MIDRWKKQDELGKSLIDSFRSSTMILFWRPIIDLIGFSLPDSLWRALWVSLISKTKEAIDEKQR